MVLHRPELDVRTRPVPHRLLGRHRLIVPADRPQALARRQPSADGRPQHRIVGRGVEPRRRRLPRQRPARGVAGLIGHSGDCSRDHLGSGTESPCYVPLERLTVVSLAAQTAEPTKPRSCGLVQRGALGPNLSAALPNHYFGPTLAVEPQGSIVNVDAHHSAVRDRTRDKDLRKIARELNLRPPRDGFDPGAIQKIVRGDYPAAIREVGTHIDDAALKMRVLDGQ